MRSRPQWSRFEIDIYHVVGGVRSLAFEYTTLKRGFFLRASLSRLVHCIRELIATASVATSKSKMPLPNGWDWMYKTSARNCPDKFHITQAHLRRNISFFWEYCRKLFSMIPGFFSLFDGMRRTSPIVMYDVSCLFCVLVSSYTFLLDVSLYLFLRSRPANCCFQVAFRSCVVCFAALLRVTDPSINLSLFHHSSSASLLLILLYYIILIFCAIFSHIISAAIFFYLNGLLMYTKLTLSLVNEMYLWYKIVVVTKY